MLKHNLQGWASLPAAQKFQTVAHRFSIEFAMQVKQAPHCIAN